MDAFVNCHKCTPARSKKITELVAFMVAKDLRLAAVIDGEGFKRLLSFLEPGYVIPSSVHTMDVVGRKYVIVIIGYNIDGCCNRVISIRPLWLMRGLKRIFTGPNRPSDGPPSA